MFNGIDGKIQRKPYRRLDLDLGIARTAQQFFEVGSFIWVEECDGVVEIKLNDNQASFFKLIDGSFYKVSEYKQFWIKNTAQAGKSLKALIGDADFFRSVRRGVYDHTKLKNVAADQHADIKVRTVEVDETNKADGKVLVFRTASGKLGYETPAGGAADVFKRLQLIVLGSDATYVDFDNLDINTDKMYMITFNIQKRWGGSHYVWLYANTDYTATNYYSQRMYAGGTDLGASRLNTPEVGYLYNTSSTSGVIFVWLDPQGYMRAVAYLSAYTPSLVMCWTNSLASNVTHANITKLRLYASIGNVDFKAGSEFQIFGVV